MALVLEDDVRDEGYDTKLKRESIELCHSERTNVQRTEDNDTKCMESNHERFVNNLVRDLEQHAQPHGRVPKDKLSSTKSYKSKRRRPALGLILNCSTICSWFCSTGTSISSSIIALLAARQQVLKTRGTQARQLTKSGENCGPTVTDDWSSKVAHGNVSWKIGTWHRDDMDRQRDNPEAHVVHNFTRVMFLNSS